MINFGSHYKLMFKANILSYRADLKYNAKSCEPFRARNVRKLLGKVSLVNTKEI